MKNLKKIMAVVVCASVLALQTMPLTAKNDKKDISVKIDGRKIEFDVNPQMENDRTLVPLRKIFEELGALVKWDNDTQTVSAKKNSKTVTLTIDSNELLIDKGDVDEEGNPIVETIILDVPARLVSGRTLVPTRAVSEAFGMEVDWDEEEQTVVVTSDENDDSWKENVGEINLSDMTFSGVGVELEDNQITVTKGGDYTITGTLEDGCITVDTEERVKLRLSNASITSSDGPCIFVKNTDKAYITLEDGTMNTLVAENSEDGAIRAKENLEFKGDGKIVITAKGGHGIKASDNLTIESGELSIAASGDGIHVNDTFKMEEGSVTIVAEGDGIDSESIVIISGGTLNIETTGKPVGENEDASTKSAEASENTEKESDEGDNQENTMPFGDRRFPMGMWMQSAEVEFEKSTKGINAEWMMVVSGGEITVDSTSHAIHCQDEIEISGGSFLLDSEYEKGISAHGNLTIGGENTIIDIQKATEGIESKNIATINDGKIHIVSTDDGINATGGSVTMQPGGGFGGRPQWGGQGSAEGEASENGQQTMPGGGFWGRPPEWGGQRPGGEEAPAEGQLENPGGGFWGRPPEWGGQRPEGEEAPAGEQPENPGGGFWGRPQWGQTTDENANGNQSDSTQNNSSTGRNRGGFGAMGGSGKDCLIINGGDIEILAGDDCLDANGSLIINGGTVKAVKKNSAFVGNMGAIDADRQVTVGEAATVIIAGGGGTQGSFSSGNNIVIYCENAKTAGDKISVLDQSGEVIAEYAPDDSFSAVMIISPHIEVGKAYEIFVGDEKYDITVSEKNSVVGTAPEREMRWGSPRTRTNEGQGSSL